jgi:hypothetical protein
MERYSSNNGIVLKQRINDWREEVLFFIQGEDVGITKADSDKDALTRAEPILRTMLHIHNRAAEWAWTEGRKEAKADVRRVLESD